MTMRMELIFQGPLSEEELVRVMLAAAELPEVRRCVVSPDRRRATWYANDISRQRVAQALSAHGCASASLISTLSPEAEAALAEAAETRFRPLGR
ncbi:MAG: hypothetical protein N3B15_01150 [Planctomycetota bacterium]|nr:hypothetical protein [Planctomycetota bacterium]